MADLVNEDELEGDEIAESDPLIIASSNTDMIAGARAREHVDEAVFVAHELDLDELDLDDIMGQFDDLNFTAANDSNNHEPDTDEQTRRRASRAGRGSRASSRATGASSRGRAGKAVAKPSRRRVLVQPTIADSFAAQSRRQQASSMQAALHWAATTEENGSYAEQPGVVKQRKPANGSVDHTKSGYQRIRDVRKVRGTRKALVVHQRLPPKDDQGAMEDVS